jgi:hypothetical protein
VVAKGVSLPNPGIVAPYLPLQYQKRGFTWPRFCIFTGPCPDDLTVRLRTLITKTNTSEIRDTLSRKS